MTLNYHAMALAYTVLGLIATGWVLRDVVYEAIVLILAFAISFLIWPIWLGGNTAIAILTRKRGAHRG